MTKFVRYTGWRHSAAIWHGIPTNARKSMIALLERDLTYVVTKAMLSKGVEDTLYTHLPTYFDQRYSKVTKLASHDFWSHGWNHFPLVLNRLTYGGWLTRNGAELIDPLCDSLRDAYLRGSLE